MSELGEETHQGQDHGISGGGDKVINVRQILSFFNSTDLLPLDSTVTGSGMMMRTRPITLTLIYENHLKI